jgi:hypothetical protein
MNISCRVRALLTLRTTPSFHLGTPCYNECLLVQGDTKKRELLKNPTKIEEIQEKIY